MVASVLRTKRVRDFFWPTSVCVLLLGGVLASAQKAPDLTQMSLEDLLSVQVTTASKKEQTLAQTPAAVYVITAEDIARSGLTSVPEVLRLAPGVEVGQISASAWAISIRGFDGQFANKLLVMIDGRTVYSPAFSGVIWNIQDLMLEDIDRIEVIRGPGASVWGANAVNGVINILTKSSRHSQGGLITAGGGNYEQGFGGVRYGGEWRRASYRVSANFLDRGPWAAVAGGSNHDRWDAERGSLRTDWSSISGRDSLTGEGELYHSDANTQLNIATFQPPYQQTVNSPYLFEGGSLLLRWKHVTDGGSEITGQGFYDRAHSNDAFQLDAVDSTFDFDFQEQVQIAPRNAVVWGLDARVVEEHTRPGFLFAFNPADDTVKLFSGFGQDEINLIRHHLWLTVGTKLERHDYAGFETEPTVRLLWSPNARNSFWTAASRAVRNPSSYEERGQINLIALPTSAGIPLLYALKGNKNVNEEELYAFEAGYRAQLNRRISIDAAAFYNIYTELSSIEPGPAVFEAAPLPHLLVPLVLANEARGHSLGGELEANYSVLRFWKLSGSYSLLRLFVGPNATHPEAESIASTDYPEHQFQLHSQLSLPHGLAFDTSGYYTSQLLGAPVPAFSRLDFHASWSPLERLQFSAGIQNLLEARHQEFLEPNRFTTLGWVPRSFYGKALWRF